MCWVKIVEYCELKNIGISTARRRIKRGDVNFKMEMGKYFIQVKQSDRDKTKKDLTEIKKENELLKRKKKELTEIIFKLKVRIEELEEKVGFFERNKHLELL